MFSKFPKAETPNFAFYIGDWFHLKEICQKGYTFTKFLTQKKHLESKVRKLIFIIVSGQCMTYSY